MTPPLDPVPHEAIAALSKVEHLLVTALEQLDALDCGWVTAAQIDLALNSLRAEREAISGEEREA